MPLIRSKIKIPISKVMQPFQMAKGVTSKPGFDQVGRNQLPTLDNYPNQFVSFS